MASKIKLPSFCNALSEEYPSNPIFLTRCTSNESELIIIFCLLTRNIITLALCFIAFSVQVVRVESFMKDIPSLRHKVTPTVAISSWKASCTSQRLHKLTVSTIAVDLCIHGIVVSGVRAQGIVHVSM